METAEPDLNNIRARSGWTWRITAVLIVIAAVGLTAYLWKPGLFRTAFGKRGPSSAQQQKDEYYCPMHPQQRSDQPGNCPICSMKLVKLEKKPAQNEQAAEEYYCPMHPQQKSNKPGNCPICSMKLVKVEKKPEAPAQPAASSMPGMAMGGEQAPAPSAPSIFVPPERQQLIGVKSVAAEARALTKEIRTVGKVAYDETKITHIHTKVAGFIEEVFVDFVGRAVKRGQPLFTIYSPELVATQEEYLLALKSKNLLQDNSFEWISSSSRNLLEATRRRLLLWDITEEQVRALEREGKSKRALTIHSPVSGIVTERAAYHHGRHVTPEMDLYTIIDLSTVWILGEIYEYELPYVRLGQVAEVDFPYNSGMKNRAGKVVFVSPTLNPKTRTVQLRLEFLNPDLVLRPDMFTNFKLSIGLGKKLVVPHDAVLDTGTEQYVFVDLGSGYFEPRPVKLGPEAGDFRAIESGLRAGEKVVTAANFILDSESRLKGAFANMGKPSQAQPPQTAAAAQNVRVEILEPRTAKVGGNNVRLVVKDPSGKPIEGAEVEIELFMPQMGNMAPMTSKARLEHAGNGEYRGRVEVPMAWTWETTVRVRKDGQTLGIAKTSITAR